MTSTPSSRPRRALVAGALLATAVTAAGLLPLSGGTAVAAPLPAPPVVGPSATGAAVKEVVLDWSAVAGATSYLLQVGRDEEWSNAPTLETTTVATRHTLPTWLPHASYVWRVAAVGPDGPGRWSTPGGFTRGWSARPEPIAPKDDLPPGTGRPDFSWTPVLGASEYQLQVSNSPMFDARYRTQAGIKTESCFTTRTRVTPFTGQASARNDGAGDCVFTLLGTGEPRWWRVRPLDHVAGEVPEVDTTPVVDEGISSLPPEKMGELDTSACPVPPTSSPVAVPPGAPTSAPPTGSCEPANPVEKGAWSASVEFTHTARPAPDPVPWFRRLTAPVLPNPCDDGTCRDFPTLSWDDVPGAQAYRVYVALDAEFTNIHQIAETRGTSWTPTTSWPDSTPGEAYHVVVQACTTTESTELANPGRAPGCAEPGEPVVFRKSSPRLTALAPDDGTAVGGTEVLLSWQPASVGLSAATGRPATSEAYAYRVQVTDADNPDFTRSRLVDEAVVDSTSYVASDKRYAEGDHLWRVQAVDASGHGQPWSTPRSFTRDSTAPTFSVAERLPVRGAVQVRFSEPVTGVDARSVTLSGVLATVTLAADGQTALVAPGRTLLPGAPHTLTVTSQVRDRAGNVLVERAVAATADPVVDDRAATMLPSGRWQPLEATDAVAGTWSRSVPTAARPTSAAVVLHGRSAEVRACLGPRNGRLEVRADGKRIALVDTYRSYSGCGVVVARPSFAVAGTHRIEVVGVGTKSARSGGTVVGVDAITAVR